VFIEFPQTDAGTRCAGLNAASMALADAGLTMKDLVCAIAAGRVEDKVVIDLNYLEDSHEDGCDIPMAILPSTGEVTLLQMDGEISAEMLSDALKLANNTAKQIYDVQKVALKEKFTQVKK